MNKTHTRLFIMNEKSDNFEYRVPIDQQINEWAEDNDCEIIQVSLVPHHMSLVFIALVIFQESES